MFGFKITPCLNEVKRIDPLALFQSYQIGHLTKKVLPLTTFPKYFEKQKFLSIKKLIVSDRKGRFPFFSFERSRLTVSRTNSYSAYISSLKSIISEPLKNLSSLKETSVQILLFRMVEKYLRVWSRRMNKFMLSSLCKAAISGLLPLFNYLNKWNLNNFKDVRKNVENYGFRSKTTMSSTIFVLPHPCATNDEIVSRQLRNIFLSRGTCFHKAETVFSRKAPIKKSASTTKPVVSELGSDEELLFSDDDDL